MGLPSQNKLRTSSRENEEEESKLFEEEESKLFDLMWDKCLSLLGDSGFIIGRNHNNNQTNLG